MTLMLVIAIISGQAQMFGLRFTSLSECEREKESVVLTLKSAEVDSYALSCVSVVKLAGA